MVLGEKKKKRYRSHVCAVSALPLLPQSIPFVLHAVKKKIKHFIPRGPSNVTATSQYLWKIRPGGLYSSGWTGNRFAMYQNKLIEEAYCLTACNAVFLQRLRDSPFWDPSRTNRWGIIHTKEKGWYVTLPSENEDMELHNAELQPAKDVSRTFKTEVIQRHWLQGQTSLLLVRILFLLKMFNDFLWPSKT